MTRTLEELIEMLHKHSLDAMANGEEVPPTFYGECSDGGVEVFITPWTNDDEKSRSIAFVRSAFLVKDVRRYVMISEAWGAQYAEGENPSNSAPPSERTNRRELIQYIGVERERVVSAFADINRVDTGARVCGPLEWPKGQLEGRMTKLLPPPDTPIPPPELRDKLMAKLANLAGINLADADRVEPQDATH